MCVVKILMNIYPPKNQMQLFLERVKSSQLRRSAPCSLFYKIDVKYQEIYIC